MGSDDTGAQRADASTAGGRAQRGRASAAREALRRSGDRREPRSAARSAPQAGGGFGNGVTTAEKLLLPLDERYRLILITVPVSRYDRTPSCVRYRDNVR